MPDEVSSAATRLAVQQPISEKVDALVHLTQEMELLKRMDEMLQACLTQEEAYRVVAHLGTEYFPTEVGQLFMLTGNRRLLVWGRIAESGGEVFGLEECWALRQGHTHVVKNTSTDLLCQHLCTPLPSAYICIPLVAHGETLGLVHIGCYTGDVTVLSEPQQRRAVDLGQILSLQLANLRLREALKAESIRDPLTGLFNRRFLDETLERELRRAKRGQRSVGLIMLDIDYFKRLNDTFGHAAGDAALKVLGELIQSSLRAGDVACRYGGEEFVLLLPEASLEATRNRAEHLREGVKRLVVSHKGKPLGAITVSIGVAAFPDHDPDAETLFQTLRYRAVSLQGRGTRPCHCPFICKIRNGFGQELGHFRMLQQLMVSYSFPDPIASAQDWKEQLRSAEIPPGDNLTIEA